MAGSPTMPASGPGRVPAVQHAVIAIGIGEERHMTNARVEGLASELDALGLKLCPFRGDVLDVERDVTVLLRRPLPPDPLWLPDAEARTTAPELVPRVLVRPQAERVDVERSRPVGIPRRDRHEVDGTEHRQRLTQPLLSRADRN